MPAWYILSRYSEPTVSSGPISTSRCSKTGPVSMPSSGQKIEMPVVVSPWMIAQLIALRPRWRGSSDGWYWIVPVHRQVEDGLRDELLHEGHDAQVRRLLPQPCLDVRITQASRVEDGDACFLRRAVEAVRPPAQRLWRRRNCDDLFALLPQPRKHIEAEGADAVEKDTHRPLRFVAAEHKIEHDAASPVVAPPVTAPG